MGGNPRGEASVLIGGLKKIVGWGAPPTCPSATTETLGQD